MSLAEWEPAKTTLHLWAQIVGKVRMASTPPRNHWWHVALYVDVRGLTTRRLQAPDGTAFRIDFDILDHRLVVSTDRGEVESFALVDGLSVAAFDEALHETLRGLGIDVAIRETPFGMPDSTPFPADREHAAYDADAVERFWRILAWTDGVFEEFAGWYCGKTSPVHPSGTRSTWRSPGSAASARPRFPASTMSPARRTRTRSPRSGSGPVTKSSASRRTTRTRRPSPPGCAR
jgi:Family of unknown function (DUF5996)